MFKALRAAGRFVRDTFYEEVTIPFQERRRLRYYRKHRELFYEPAELRRKERALNVLRGYIHGGGDPNDKRITRILKRLPPDVLVDDLLDLAVEIKNVHIWLCKSQPPDDCVCPPNAPGSLAREIQFRAKPQHWVIDTLTAYHQLWKIYRYHVRPEGKLATVCRQKENCPCLPGDLRERIRKFLISSDTALKEVRGG